MHRPTAATEAATVLLDMATADPHALPFLVHGLPGDDPLTALTRSPRDAVAAALKRPMMGGRSWAGSDLVASLPPVLVPLVDLRTIGGTMDRTPPPEALAESAGFPYPVGVPTYSGKRHRDRQRVRRVVLAGPEAAPTPDGSRALTISTLTARQVAEDLDRWATVLPVGRARLVDREAITYRAYADAAESLIPASFAWADEVVSPAVTPAFQTVPVTLRGYARAGA